MAVSAQRFSGFDSAQFTRLGITLRPNELTEEREGILNPASARLRDGTLQLYPRMVAPGNVSRIGSFRTRESNGESLLIEQIGYALEPQAPYEFRSEPGGYGCEDPRVTFIAALDLYVMAYVAFGSRGPEVALAVSPDGLNWERLGLVRFQKQDDQFADKDAAFFPEPVRAPSGMPALALYHRPTRWPTQQTQGINIAYAPLDEVRVDITRLCAMTETHRVEMPAARWGAVKVGAGTPPVRIREGWLSVVHGVDAIEYPDRTVTMRYCAGIIVHDAISLERVIYRSPTPLFVPEVPGELAGTVGNVVFPTAIDPRAANRSFDIYYGMADYEIGRGRLTL